MIRNISRSSNSQNKVSDADFFASHPFHRRMEQISRHLFAPASEGAQYETKWFYERARGQYLQEQMRLTPAKKKQFELQHPKNKVIKKTDLAKVQNTWRGFPQIVSKGAQTNFNSFAEYIDEQWNANEEQFNERYFQTTAALILLFQYLEKTIPKQPWYEGGYRANIIYYTLAQFRRLLHSQYQGRELDLMLIWNRQSVPEQVGTVLIALAELVLLRITDPSRKVANVTQWCKRNDCWEDVKKIHIDIPEDITNIGKSKLKRRKYSVIFNYYLDNGIQELSYKDIRSMINTQRIKCEIEFVFHNKNGLNINVDAEDYDSSYEKWFIASYTETINGVLFTFRCTCDESFKYRELNELDKTAAHVFWIRYISYDVYWDKPGQSYYTILVNGIPYSMIDAMYDKINSDEYLNNRHFFEEGSTLFDITKEQNRLLTKNNMLKKQQNFIKYIDSDGTITVE